VAWDFDEFVREVDGAWARFAAYVDMEVGNL
jgi:hypothetical protein